MKKIIVILLLLVLVIIGIPMAILNFFNEETIIEPIESRKKVSVFLQNKKQVVEMDLEEYIKGVVASEMPGEFEMEALKAQAVAARTYALSRIKIYDEKGNSAHPQAPLCDGVHCQVFLSREDLQKAKSAQWMLKYWPKISEAVEKTQGMVMIYEDELVTQPLFHSTSGGRTANSEDVFVAWVPYLRSVESPYEEGAPHLKDTVTISLQEFKTKVQSKYKNLNLDLKNIGNLVQILERNTDGRVRKIKVGNLILSGRDVRETLGLRSANFTVTISGDKIIFNTVGFGHGVGMSQWGANGMAGKGSNYTEILKHYYQGIELTSLY